MPRTDTTVINDIIRQVGEVHDLKVEWNIPVERAGWDCHISITLDRWYLFRHKGLSIDVHVYGHPTEGPYRGLASYSALSGHAPPSRLTRKWLDQVLRREIETAHAAALSFTEDDLHEVSSSKEDFDEQIKEVQAMREYFRSSLP